jgi:hypothetical protein
MSTPKGMKRGLTSYGDADFSLFLRKAFVKSMGYSDDALTRPIVGIANTFSDYNACHGNVPQLMDAIKRGVMLAGGLPMAFPTISIHESFRHFDRILRVRIIDERPDKAATSTGKQAQLPVTGRTGHVIPGDGGICTTQPRGFSLGSGCVDWDSH